MLGIAIMLIGRYSGHFGKIWLLGVGCTSRIHTQYKWRLAKDCERPTKRAIMTIIMHSDIASSINVGDILSGYTHKDSLTKVAHSPG